MVVEFHFDANKIPNVLYKQNIFMKDFCKYSNIFVSDCKKSYLTIKMYDS